MGLDQYLYRETYVKNWNFMKPEELHEITIKRGGVVREDIKPERISGITEQVAYWRKANQIHKWFVDNVQDGKDDCGRYRVSAEQLTKLVDACKQVLNAAELVDGKVCVGHQLSQGEWTPMLEDGKVLVASAAAIAADLLPPQSGFFFGSTDFDGYYIDDLRRTVEMLEPLLKDDESDYYYRSSW